MTTRGRWRTALGAGAVTAAISAGVLVSGAEAADSCPNASVRTDASAALPNCRAFELVSPDINHASLGSQPSGSSSPDGQTFFYQTIDAPKDSQSASPFNAIIATRDQAEGWAGASMSPPVSAPTTSFNSALTFGLAPDFNATFEMTDQPLVDGTLPPGANAFVGSPKQGYKLVTKVGFPFFAVIDVYSQASFLWGNHDFSNLYFQPPSNQLPSDPTFGYNTYAWSSTRGLQLVGILPNDTAAPNGANLVGSTFQPSSADAPILQPASSDGRYVLFRADNHVYVRDMVDESTVEVGTSAYNPTPTSQPGQAGITPDGSTVLFLSRSELTNTSNTGDDGNGNNTEAGQDLYRYDRVHGTLTDLTPDTNPADSATGANVQSVMAATDDASRIYFTATSVLAAGAQPGHTSLYVWHDNQIEYVADFTNLARETQSNRPGFAMTPDGLHIAFASSDSLTGYDNTDPSTGNPHYELYRAGIGEPVRCVSCRADGTRPTGDSLLPLSYRGMAPSRLQRVLTDDGKRLFFQSTDRLVDGATTGTKQLYQDENGSVAPISDVTSSLPATFLDASASGDDVFFTTYTTLVPNDNGNDMAVYDARVGGGWEIPKRPTCDGPGCYPAPTPPPALPTAGSVTFTGPGNAKPDEGNPPTKVTVSKVATIHGTSGVLKIKVPGKGTLSVTGSGLRTKRAKPSKAQTIKVRAELTAKAKKTLRKKRSYSSKAKVTFTDASGHKTTATVTLKFKLAARKG